LKLTYYFSTQGCKRALSSAFSDVFCFELPEAAAAAAAAALALLLKKFDAIDFQYIFSISSQILPLCSSVIPKSISEQCRYV
jgi:uncharacterized membrane protein